MCKKESVNKMTTTMWQILDFFILNTNCYMIQSCSNNTRYKITIPIGIINFIL